LAGDFSGRRPHILFVAEPAASALTGILACERRGWSADVSDDVAEGLDRVDSEQPDVVVVPLDLPRVPLDRFCALATQHGSPGHRAVIAWSMASPTPAVSHLTARWGAFACVSRHEGADALCDEIARWLSMPDHRPPTPR
jgi:hypothetical protein